jgi:hypothetical protein
MFSSGVNIGGGGQAGSGGTGKDAAAFTGQFALNNTVVTEWNDLAQTGFLTLSEGPNSKLGGIDQVKITANGSGISVPGTWVNVGNASIDPTNGVVNRIIIYKAVNEIQYFVQGGGAPAGGINSIQTNNGSGGFTGVGELTASLLKIGTGSPSAGGRGFQLRNGLLDFSDEYLAFAGSFSGSSTINFLSAINVPNNSNFTVEVNVQAIQSSGTVADTGFALKLIANFRVQGSSFSKIGATVDDANFKFNNTGDVFGALTITNSASSCDVTVNLTTTKTFKMAVWVKLKGVAI